jgi:methylated-DNA-protein-cysteine methyltransferase-like protein
MPKEERSTCLPSFVPQAEGKHVDRKERPLRVAIEAAVRATRPGEVVTYGEIAAEAGHPGAARAVGNVLATSDGELPWWRVVTSTGRLVPGHEVDHARRLRNEGVEIDRTTMRVRMARR